MGFVIDNGRFRAEIAQLGAELKSLVDLSTGQEYMWQADPFWWKGSAPILFPIVGGLKGETYTYEGREYRLPQHGFARSREFGVVGSEQDAVELELAAGNETLAQYPFDFALRVGFFLELGGLTVRYRVTNRGSGSMYFSIGSHPAFNVPFRAAPPGTAGALENYYILFEREENLERYFFKDGTIVPGKTAEILDSSRTLTLSRNLFDSGPVIFKNPSSREFTIANSRNPRAIRVATDGVPFVAIWSKPGGAPFVCIEPWHGLPDAGDASGNLIEKEGIISLPPHDSFSTGYRIEIL